MTATTTYINYEIPVVPTVICFIFSIVPRPAIEVYVPQIAVTDPCSWWFALGELIYSSLSSFLPYATGSISSTLFLQFIGPTAPWTPTCPMDIIIFIE